MLLMNHAAGLGIAVTVAIPAIGIWLLYRRIRYGHLRFDGRLPLRLVASFGAAIAVLELFSLIRQPQSEMLAVTWTWVSALAAALVSGATWIALRDV